MKASWLILLVELLPSFLAQQEVSSKLSESCSTFANNTLGSCACSGQLFFNDDCQHGFYCMEDADFPTPEDAAMYDGCAIECASDEILLVDARNGGGWMCRKWHGGTPLICPGHFNTECACKGGPDACPMGDCECDGQLWVSDDCKAAKSCTGTAEGGFEHQEISCPEENQIVYVHLVSHIWYCGEDDGNCPGTFNVGCQADQTEAPTGEPTEDPTQDTTEDPDTQRPFTLCSYAKNDLGTCECPGQVFIAHECHKGFMCMDFTDGNFPDSVVNGGFDGCVKECRDDEVLVVDPRRGDWECVPTVVNATFLNEVCPGKFNTECACTGGEAECPIGECECQGQLRVAHDCHDARYCNGTDLANPNGHLDINCPAPNIVYVNMATNAWECGPDDGRCPGAFHVGCRDDSYNGSNNLSLSAIMASLLPMFVTYVYSMIRV